MPGHSRVSVHFPALSRSRRIFHRRGSGHAASINKTMPGRCTRAAIVSLALTASLASAAEQDVLEEVVVTATLRQQSLVEAPVSVTVLDTQTLRDAGRQHFEDVLASVPNLSYASGTSRPRFFQIRGIGEREEWQGAPNPSVGFLIDDIDFSGMGMPATTFDVDRIEVLRGPQGLHYGANALGGLIVMRGRDPEDQFGFSTEASIGEYNSQSHRRGGDRSGRVAEFGVARGGSELSQRRFSQRCLSRPRRHDGSRRAHRARQMALASEREHDRRPDLAACRSR